MSHQLHCSQALSCDRCSFRDRWGASVSSISVHASPDDRTASNSCVCPPFHAGPILTLLAFSIATRTLLSFVLVNALRRVAQLPFHRHPRHRCLLGLLRQRGQLHRVRRASPLFCSHNHQFELAQIAWDTILKRALDLITIVVPPALPATMSIGTSFAIARLRKLGVFCISPNRVNIGGKVNLMCFDKTGTLTEDGLDVLGVRSVDRSDGCFSDLYTDAEDVPIIGAADAKTPLLHALATCHALKLVNGEVIGDPLDLRMFEFTRWTLEEGKEGSSRPSTDISRRSTDLPRKSIDKAGARIPDRPATLVQTIVRPPGGEGFQLEDALKVSGRVHRLCAFAIETTWLMSAQHAHFLELGVIRTFDFVSSLRRMSVLVKKLKSQSVEVYVKGAPEVMTEICDKSTCACHARSAQTRSLTAHSTFGLRRAARLLHPTWFPCHRSRCEEHSYAHLDQGPAS